jgi:hypothetical protein
MSQQRCTARLPDKARCAQERYECEGLTFDPPRPPASKSVCSDKVSTQRQAQTGRPSGSARDHGYSILNWLIDYQASIVHGPCVSQSSTLTNYDQTQGVSALVLAFGAARLKSRFPPASNPAGTCDRKGRAHERRWIISVWLHGRIDADYDLRDLGSLAARGSNLTAAMTVYLAVLLLFAFTCGAVPWAVRSLPNRHRRTTGIVFDFPWLCWRRRRIARSLSTGIGRYGEKMPHRSLASPNFFPAEFALGNRDRFEDRLQRGIGELRDMFGSVFAGEPRPRVLRKYVKVG